MPRGRPKKPTANHILTGTFRDDRHGGDEPQPLAGAPKCPPHLSDDAKQIWRELVRVLACANVLTQADTWVMERFCSCVVRLRAYEAQLDQLKPSAMANETAAVMLKRLFVIVRGETTTLTTLGASLGLSPAARTQLEINTGGQRAGVSARDRSKGPPPPSEASA